jgi:hypothetical protein
MGIVRTENIWTHGSTGVMFKFGMGVKLAAPLLRDGHGVKEHEKRAMKVIFGPNKIHTKLGWKPGEKTT